MPQILYWIEVWALTRPFQNISMFPLKPLKCCFSSMLRVIVLLEGEPPSQSQTETGLPQEFPCIYLHPSFLKFWPVSQSLPLKNIHSMILPTQCFTVDDVLGVMKGVGFAAVIAFSLMAKKLNFSLIWPEYLLTYVWGVSHMPFGEHQTCLLIFLWPLFGKAQLCGVYALKWSYGQILQSPLWSFTAPSGLSLVSLLPLWLMPSLPGPWVLVGGPLLGGLLWCHILSMF